MHVDEVNSEKRLTYTIFDGNIPKGILQIAMNGWENDILYFQLGIAIGNEYRNKGIGYEISQKGINEFIYNMQVAKVQKLGIEAVVSKSNIASQKLAAKIFHNTPNEIIDKYSGEEALQYEFIVTWK